MTTYNPYQPGPDIGAGINDFLSLYMMFDMIKRMYPKETKELDKMIAQRDASDFRLFSGGQPMGGPQGQPIGGMQGQPMGQPQGPIGGTQGQPMFPPQGASPGMGVSGMPQGIPQDQLAMILQMLSSMPRR